MCRILLECLAGVLFGFLGFAVGMFFGTVIWNAAIGGMLGVIGLAYFLNIAKRFQEKRGRKLLSNMRCSITKIFFLSLYVNKPTPHEKPSP
ncbi:MAG: hypothetical protein ACJ0IZ_10730 [Verrucomicrobiales bacterium]